MTRHYYRWLDEDDLPQSIGRLSGFMGNAGVLLRAYVYMRMLGRVGMARVAEFSTLNANYVMARLREHGFELAYPERRATHEFIISLRHEAKELGVTAMDFAKRLLDYGYHAPTTYFPLLVPECLLIEPTETESKQSLDRFADTIDLAASLRLARQVTVAQARRTAEAIAEVEAHRATALGNPIAAGVVIGT